MIGSNNRLPIFLVVSLLTFLVLNSCVTQKKKGDLSAMQKLYHNTTSKYNGYFNANVLYEASVLSLNEQHQDNHNKILPVFKFTETEDPKIVSEDMDKAIKKVSVVVSLHREADWVDDCYLLMGKSQFLKQDYESAEEAFEYMIAEFNPQAIAKKKARKQKKAKKKGSKTKKGKKEKQKEIDSKKKDRKKMAKEVAKEREATKKARKKGEKIVKGPSAKEKMAAAKKAEEEEAKREEEANNKKEVNEAEKDFLKKRPAYHEGLIWLAMTYVERENFLGAERMFNELENTTNLSDEVLAIVGPAKAYYFLEQDQNEAAIEPLLSAIELADDRNDKARYSFILAQIHQESGRNNEALANFQQAKKYSTEYELDFASELYVLKNSLRSGNLTADIAEKKLEKMLKEAKNNDYQDQIYFVLADIAIQANDNKKAIEYLSSSLETNSLNTAQKGESHLLLADLYFEEENFVESKKNYDAALTSVSKNDERYFDIKKRSEGLIDIAKNIELITLQDSLLRMSTLTDKERRKLAAKMKRQEVNDALAAAKGLATTTKSSSKSNGPIPKTLSAGNVRADLAGKSNFFAYNEKAIKRGSREFAKTWPGRVKLENNWRRASANSGDINDNIEDASIYEEALTDEEINAYFKGVPSTDEEKQVVNNKIETALFELGTLYRDRLDKNEKCIKTLEELNTRYPGTKHEVDSWYFMYLAYKDLGDAAKAQTFFDKIMDKYPSSVYARVLKDPNYLAQSQNKEIQVNKYYNETYAQFTANNYPEVKKMVDAVPGRFGKNNSHQARFALLGAMSLGKVENKDAYIVALKDIITTYPSTPEEKRAKEILRLLGDQSIVDAGLLDPDKIEAANEIFKIEDDKVHYGIVVFDQKVNLTKVKANISDYHRKNHRLDQLRISNIYLGSDTNRPLIIIRKFKNKEGAMKYYDGAQRDIESYISIKDEFAFFVVNQFNYREILRNKSAVEYKTFFAEHYLGR